MTAVSEPGALPPIADAEIRATARVLAGATLTNLEYVTLPTVWGERFSDDERQAAGIMRAALERELDATRPADL